MTVASKVAIAVFIVSLAWCSGVNAAGREANDQLAEAQDANACVASVVRAGDPTAASRSVTFAAPAPGTRYGITSGYFQIVSVDGMTVTTVNASQQMMTWYAGMIYTNHPIDKGAAEAIWPLEVGKTVTFPEQSGEDAWCHVVTTLREESIVTPAGSFAAVVIEDRLRSLRAWQGNLDLTRTYWYAPAARWVVKRDVKQNSGPPFQTAPYTLNTIVAASEQPQRWDPRWAKIACEDAQIELPFTQKHDCYRGPIGKGDDGTCHIENYGTAGGDNTVGFEIYLSLAGGRCGIYFAGDDEQEFIMAATGLSRNGRDFSNLKLFGSSQVMSFTGKDNTGQHDCFAFATIGPTLHRSDALYRYTLRGHVCRKDGTKLSDAEIGQLVRSISVD